MTSSNNPSVFFHSSFSFSHIRAPSAFKKLQIKAVLHARVVKKNILQNCGIDVQRRLYRLLTRPSTCYGAQYVRHLVSPLN